METTLINDDILTEVGSANSNVYYGKCIECENERSSLGWCNVCDVKILKDNFRNWKSGNPITDEFIKLTQLSATQNLDYLEYIDFDQLILVENTNKGGAFSTIYSAFWLEGPRWIWDEEADQWTRNGPIKVALKILNGSSSMNEEYLSQLYKYRCLLNIHIAEVFGITRDNTSNFILVMKYYDNEDLHSYLDNVKGMLCWRDIVELLWGISEGINKIHEKGLIHGHLHGGNLLIETSSDSVEARVSDVGLHFPLDKANSNIIYGVLPYVAPEVLRGNPIKKASDIFSFGIIMWTLSAGIRPWCNRPHDLKLASDICSGLRPEIIDGTPNVYTQLMTQCWDPDPSKRPTASELNELLGKWINAICDDPHSSELSYEFDIAEENKFSNLDKNEFYQPEIHPESFYTSRHLYFPELVN
ncbi:5679_t:CDS:2 [Funneliformis geosporum]|uniref:5679_t:CDS:1 n=1 Tax=Funneliformis geosporum TaxID=1117311 RepID=A0A9W4SAP6_9GLOM|nr:5679_t:CDS:2 [Funneliformis geosporum]